MLAINSTDANGGTKRLRDENYPNGRLLRLSRVAHVEKVLAGEVRLICGGSVRKRWLSSGEVRWCVVAARVRPGRGGGRIVWRRPTLCSGTGLAGGRIHPFGEHGIGRRCCGAGRAAEGHRHRGTVGPPWPRVGRNQYRNGCAGQRAGEPDGRGVKLEGRTAGGLGSAGRACVCVCEGAYGSATVGVATCGH